MDITEYQYGNAIIKVYRPKLSQGERESRELRVKNALQQFGKSMIKENRNEYGNTSGTICKKQVLDRQT